MLRDVVMAAEEEIHLVFLQQWLIGGRGGGEGGSVGILESGFCM